MPDTTFPNLEDTINFRHGGLSLIPRLLSFHSSDRGLEGTLGIKEAALGFLLPLSFVLIAILIQLVAPLWRHYARGGEYKLQSQ